MSKYFCKTRAVRLSEIKHYGEQTTFAGHDSLLSVSESPEVVPSYIIWSMWGKPHMLRPFSGRKTDWLPIVLRVNQLNVF